MKRLLNLLVIGALGACSSSNSTAPTTAHLVISLAAAQVSAQPGNRLSVATEVTRENGPANPVTVTVSAPTGVTASVASVSTSGNSITASISIAVGSATLPGGYTVSILARATGYPDATAQFVVEVN
jgi:hypothetical protein